MQLEELRSPGICQSIHMKVIASRKLHTDKLMISEVMSFVCLDSYENGITKEKVYTKGSGKLPFSEYLRFQSNGLELSTCQILGLTCATIWWKKKQGLQSRIPRKDLKRMSMPASWREFLGFLIPLPVHI